MTYADRLMVYFMVRFEFDVVVWNGIEILAYKVRKAPLFHGAAADGQLELYKSNQYLDTSYMKMEWKELEDELPVSCHFLAGRSRQLKKQWRAEWGYEL